MHEPVLLKEVLAFLNLKPSQRVVDATVGSAGHAREILKQIGPRGRLIAMDQDPEAIRRAKENLKAFPQVEFVEENFSHLNEAMLALNLPALDAVLLDVGISSEQLEEASRGFSFLKEGPLDMRMDPTKSVTASDLVNDLSQEELEDLFRTYGEERWSRRIAQVICRERERKRVETTQELVALIQKAVPRRFHFGRRHPAMRVFQALRIKVNEELEALESALPQALQVLDSGGRMVVISFHSLEDRIVKHTFRAWAEKDEVKVLTQKVVQPTEEETRRNPRSRSARLRAIEKI